MSDLRLDREGFELCARTNLNYALEVLERVEAEPGSLRKVKLDNAAATIRELLRLDDGAYFERESARERLDLSTRGTPAERAEQAKRDLEDMAALRSKSC